MHSDVYDNAGMHSDVYDSFWFEVYMIVNAIVLCILTLVTFTLIQGHRSARK